MTDGLCNLSADFDAFVVTGVSLIEFWAEWCGPCRALDPVLKSLAYDLSDVNWGKVEITEQPELAERFGVRSAPTLIVFVDGVAVKTMIGTKTRRQILRMLDRAEPVPSPSPPSYVAAMRHQWMGGSCSMTRRAGRAIDADKGNK